MLSYVFCNVYYMTHYCAKALGTYALCDNFLLAELTLE